MHLQGRPIMLFSVKQRTIVCLLPGMLSTLHIPGAQFHRFLCPVQLSDTMHV